MKIFLANCLSSRFFFLAKVTLSQTRMPLRKWQTRYMPRIFLVQWSSIWASLILRYVIPIMIRVLCTFTRVCILPHDSFIRICGEWFLQVVLLTCPQARKDVCNIYGVLLRRQLGSRSPTVDTIATRPDIIFNTLKGCV